MPTHKPSRAQPTGFLFAADAEYVGGFTSDAMQILVVTSLFASFLAFHCNTARYHYALARDGLLPRALSHTHPKYGSPIVAGAIQLAIARQNPYLQLGTALYGLAVIGVVQLEAIACASILGFFLKRDEDASKWGTIVAPSLAVLGLTVGLVYMVKYYSTLTGSKEAWINALPWLLVLAAVLGATAATILRARHPSEYAQMGKEPAGMTPDRLQRALGFGPRERHVSLTGRRRRSTGHGGLGRGLRRCGCGGAALADRWRRPLLLGEPGAELRHRPRQVARGSLSTFVPDELRAGISANTTIFSVAAGRGHQPDGWKSRLGGSTT